ncbi:magnesium/cobalt transporter CorA [Thermodesulfobacteriota bacterium]
MLGFMKKTSNKVGLPPGTLLHVGEKKAEEIKISIIDYDEQTLEEKQLGKIEDAFPLKDTPTVSWINIDGLHEVDIIEKVGKHFGLHPLVLEDIVHTGQRPKMDDFDDYLFIVSQMLLYDGEEDKLIIEQFSLVIGPHYILSFQEMEGDVFQHVRERIRKAKGRIRKMGPDYLAYALMDAIVDQYFVVLEKIGERIELLEEELLEKPTPETMQMIHNLKRELIFLRKSVWPLREIIANLERGESDLIQEKTTIFLRDVYDHTIQVIDTVETFRDMASGMLDVYLSSVSNRMNEVMKVLTIIATIFIPLTFIAGVYGMNFKFMPELEWHWSYPLVWAVMLVVAIVMLFYFKRKKWL